MGRYDAMEGFCELHVLVIILMTRKMMPTSCMLPTHENPTDLGTGLGAFAFLVLGDAVSRLGRCCVSETLGD